MCNTNLTSNVSKWYFVLPRHQVLMFLAFNCKCLLHAIQLFHNPVKSSFNQLLIIKLCKYNTITITPKQDKKGKRSTPISDEVNECDKACLDFLQLNTDADTHFCLTHWFSMHTFSTPWWGVLGTNGLSLVENLKSLPPKKNHQQKVK